MLEEILNIKDSNNILFVSSRYKNEVNDLSNTFKNIVIAKNEKEKNKLIEIINNSKLKKIYFLGYDTIYDYLIPRIKKEIEICWIYLGSFSSLSEENKRIELHYIFEYMDRDFVKYIGCNKEENIKVFKNAGYLTEYINYNPKINIKNSKKSNSIGIISNDEDPNNNYYNQLAALKFIEYEKCKVMYKLNTTKKFMDYFEIKAEKVNSKEELLKNNFVNLYINFTNTNENIIIESFNYGVPCIVGNTSIFNKNKFLKEHLVIKSDDDINEIAEKILFVQNNKGKILEVYEKFNK